MLAVRRLTSIALWMVSANALSSGFAPETPSDGSAGGSACLDEEGVMLAAVFLTRGSSFICCGPGGGILSVTLGPITVFLTAELLAIGGVLRFCVGALGY